MLVARVTLALSTWFSARSRSSSALRSCSSMFASHPPGWSQRVWRSGPLSLSPSGPEATPGRRLSLSSSRLRVGPLEENRLDETVQVPVQDRGDVPRLLARPMIFDQLVRGQDVGPDLAAPGDGRLFPLELGHLLVLLALHVVVEPGPQDLHGHGLILVLRALVLAGGHDPGGQVGDADGGVGHVDVLPAVPPGPERIDPEVLLLDLDLDVVGDLG